MQTSKKEMWFCIKCGYREPVSKYKQSPVRFCPECFKEKRGQIPMKKK